ncbi:MAG: outer membrane protein assembly factor BamE [Pseudomonadota bacterium]
MKKIIILTTLVMTWVLTACSDNLFTVHKIDVQQGNALREQSIEQLKIGMKPEQVRFLLGHPLVTDPFHRDRWYYVYYFKPGSGQLQERRLTVYFNEGRVARIEKPQATELASSSETDA